MTDDDTLADIATEDLEAELRRRSLLSRYDALNSIDDLFHPFHSQIVDPQVWEVLSAKLLRNMDGSQDLFGEMVLRPEDLLTVLSGIARALKELIDETSRAVTQDKIERPKIDWAYLPGELTRQSPSGPRVRAVIPMTSLSEVDYEAAEQRIAVRPGETVTDLRTSTSEQIMDGSKRFIPERICGICNKDLVGHNQEQELEDGSGHAFRAVPNASKIAFDIPSEG